MAALTRNLYREDEVLASLRWAILHGRIQEVAFWTQECIDSNMIPAAVRAIWWSWLFGFGPSFLDWLIPFRELLQRGVLSQPDRLVTVAVHLARRASARDTTVFAMLALGLEEPGAVAPDRITMAAPLPGAWAKEDQGVGRALFQGKTLLAWSLLRNRWATGEGWRLVEAAFQAKHPELVEPFLHLLRDADLWLDCARDPAWTWPLRAVAVAVAAATSGAVPRHTAEPEIVLEVEAARVGWSLLPMRLRRQVSPAPNALYWFTARGGMRVNETTERELMDGLEPALLASTFWGPLAPELCDPDIRRELFYETYFPTDIPDEWSSAARQVSHGFGSVPVGDNIRHDILFQRCLTRWMSSAARFVWDGTSRAVAALATRWSGPQRPATLEGGFLQEYEHLIAMEGLLERMATWDLSPKRRVLIAS